MKKYLLFALLMACFGYTIAQAPYCSPVFSNGCQYGDQIQNFSTSGGITNITNNNSGCSAGYYDHITGQSVTVNAGTSFNISVQSGSGYSQGHKIWIDWNQDTDFMDPGEEVWNSGTSGTQVFTGTINVPLTAVAGVTRMRVRCSYVSIPTDPCASQSYGEVEDYDLEVVPLSGDDAGIVAVDSPAVPACSLGNNVWVTIQNFGSNTLTSATVDWTINTVAQTTFNWTGSLTSGQSETFMLGTAAIADGDVLEVWTSDPNGITEGATTQYNDTTMQLVSLGISGIRTIGASGTADYLTFTDAVNDIVNFGVCGAVIFEVEGGTYTEQLTLTEIASMDPSNMVTFRSQSGDSTSVILTYAGTGSASNYVLNFDGGDYFTFENMTLQNTGTTYGRVIEVGNNSTNNSIRNSILQGNVNATSTSTNIAVVYSTSTTPSTDSDWMFENNIIRGGSYGVYWYGESSTPYQENNTRFYNNTFEEQYYRGARLYYQKNVEFVGNSASYDAGYSTGMDVFYFGYCDSSLLAVNNSVYLDGLYGDGMSFYYCEGDTLNHVMAYNNSISINAPNTTSTLYGLYDYNTEHAHYYHNSIYTNGKGNSVRGMYSTGGLETEVVNNTFYNDSTGYALYYVGSSVSVSDYNNVYSPNSSDLAYWGSAIATFNDWQSSTPYGTHSLSVDPVYNAPDDLQSCASELDNAGTYVGIMEDYDGQMRSTTVPDIGFNEFFSPASMEAGMDTSKCIGQPVTVGYPSSTGSFSWSSGETTNMITVAAPGAYVLTGVGSCGTGIDTVEITDIPDAMADFDQATSFLTAIITDQSAGADSWFWDFGDGNTSTMQNPVHPYNAPGQYIITLVVTGPCGSDTTTQIFEATTVDVNELEETVNLTAYPNPVTNNLSVVLQAKNTIEPFTVMISDLTGKMIVERTVLMSSNSSVINFNVSDVSSGIYSLSVTSDSYTKTIKFVKR